MSHRTLTQVPPPTSTTPEAALRQFLAGDFVQIISGEMRNEESDTGSPAVRLVHANSGWLCAQALGASTRVAIALNTNRPPLNLAISLPCLTLSMSYAFDYGPLRKSYT
jgi:hypothetical protein